MFHSYLQFTLLCSYTEQKKRNDYGIIRFQLTGKIELILTYIAEQTNKNNSYTNYNRTNLKKGVVKHLISSRAQNMIMSKYFVVTIYSNGTKPYKEKRPILNLERLHNHKAIDKA